MAKVFIDGSAGTTGLRIYERLEDRKDIELIRLSEELRKDTQARREALGRADIAFLCLPDDAAREAVSLIENNTTAVIDTSTAHRTAGGWVYGMPELTGQREKIAASKRIANPGCHAGGFIALVAPLVQAGVIDQSAKLSCFSLTGYSGGGKKMIAQYEDVEGEPLLEAPRMYGLTQTHKHLPEMQQICGLEHAPVFCPVVAPFYAGMQVTVPLTDTDPETVKNVYRGYYTNGLIRFSEAEESGFLSAGAFAGKDNMTVSVFGNCERLTLVARFDNLGKGASGAAVQNMNLLLGVAETTGLNI